MYRPIMPKPNSSSELQMTNKNDRSFHMDRGKIVCNGCGGHFPNLILFENHNHDHEFNMEANKPARKSGPRTVHKTFSTMSQEEMDEAMVTLPELQGCWVQEGKYICCMCGKGYTNPFLLFSHKISHPNNMRPVIQKPAPGIQTQTPNQRGLRKANLKCIVPTIYQKEDESDEEFELEEVEEIDVDLEDVDEQITGGTQVDEDELEAEEEEEEEEEDSLIPRVTKAVLKVPPDEGDGVDEALPISFDGTQELIQVPWLSIDQLKKSDTHGESRGKKTYLYKMITKKSQRCTYVNLNKESAKNIVVVKPKTALEKQEQATGGRRITNPGQEKGLTFEELDLDKMKKVFKTLPGLEKCKMKNDKFECDKCRRAFDNPYMLFSHRLIHKDVMQSQETNPVSESQSQEPQLVFYSLPGMNNCKMVGGEYYCDICPKKFSNPYLLFTHKMSVHDNNSTTEEDKSESEKEIEIEKESAFGNIFGANGLSHCKIEEGLYHCDKCSRFFHNPYLLLNHKLIHENGGVKDTPVSVSASTQVSDDEDSEVAEVHQIGDDLGLSYECNLCQMEFESLEGLATHIEIHTKENYLDADYEKLSVSSMSNKNLTDKLVSSEINRLVNAVSAEPITSNPGRNEAVPFAVTAENEKIKSGTETETFPLVKVKEEPVRIYPGEIPPPDVIAEMVKNIKPDPDAVSAGTSGVTLKRPAVENTEQNEFPLAKTIKKEPVRVYPGETTQSEAETQTQAPAKMKVKVVLKPKESPSISTQIRGEPLPQHNPEFIRVSKVPAYCSKYELKRAEVRLERLNVKPNQVCILR